MNFRPLHDRVLVRRLEAEDKSAGGILLPGNAKEKPIQGEVLATGPGQVRANGELRALDVKVGDRVLFGKYSGTEVKVGEEKLVVMREDDIMAVLA